MINKKYKNKPLDSILVSALVIVMSIMMFIWVFDNAMILMSKPSILYFFSGILLIIFSAIGLIYLNHRIYISLSSNNLVEPNKETPPNEAGGDVDRLKALRILNNHFKDEGKIGHLTDRQVKLVLDAMEEHKKNN